MHEPTEPRIRDTLIERHIRAITAANMSLATVTSRRQILNRIDREIPGGLVEASTDQLVDWLATAGRTPKSRETYWCHLRGFFTWAAGGRRPRIAEDPSADIPRPRVGRHLPRVATSDQIDHALSNLCRPALRAVILALGLGMRAEEIADAHSDSIDRNRAVILGKGDKMRRVPMLAEVWDEISTCRGYLVTPRNGSHARAQWVSLRVSTALTAIGEPNLTLHFFRGAYATRLRRAGADTAVIAKLLGHSSVATTEKYLAFVDQDLEEAVKRLPPLQLPRVEPTDIRLDPGAAA